MPRHPVIAFFGSVRGIGLVLIGLTAIALAGLYRMEHAALAHPATAGELLVALVAVLAGLPGLAMISEGDALLREPPARS